MCVFIFHFSFFSVYFCTIYIFIIIIIRLIEARPTTDDWYSLSLICCQCRATARNGDPHSPGKRLMCLARVYLWSCQMTMRVKLSEHGNGKLAQNCSLPFPTSHSHSHSHEIGTSIPIPMGFPTFAHL